FFVPGEAEPVESLEDRARGFISTARPVRVLDAEEERAAVLLCVEPVEERGARAADVEVPRGRWCEAHARRSGGVGHASERRKRTRARRTPTDPWTEREGFEPSIEVYPLCRFSKPVPSATRPSLPDGERYCLPGFH